MDNKICALIRQTWYETAKKNLQPEERLRFYEICLEYEFFGNMPGSDVPFAAKLLFDMVRENIDADKQKAAARAERARQNGRAGGRPKLPEENTTQDNANENNPKNPVGSKKPTIYTTYTQTKTQHNNESVQENEDSHTFFCVLLDFFARGCSAPHAEADKFWNYYEAMGWKTKGGGDIVDRVALARAWRLSDCSKLAMRNRAAYVDLLRRTQATETVLIDYFVSCVRNAKTEQVELTFERQECGIILDNKYIPQLRQWIPKKDNGEIYELQYKFLQQSLD